MPVAPVEAIATKKMFAPVETEIFVEEPKFILMLPALLPHPLSRAKPVVVVMLD